MDRVQRMCRDEIDFGRLTRRARETVFEEALDAVQAFDAEWSESDPDPDTLETWANNGPQKADS